VLLLQDIQFTGTFLSLPLLLSAPYLGVLLMISLDAWNCKKSLLFRRAPLGFKKGRTGFVLLIFPLPWNIINELSSLS
jgi:hypothetical protein